MMSNPKNKLVLKISTLCISHPTILTCRTLVQSPPPLSSCQLRIVNGCQAGLHLFESVDLSGCWPLVVWHFYHWKFVRKWESVHAHLMTCWFPNLQHLSRSRFKIQKLHLSVLSELVCNVFVLYCQSIRRVFSQVVFPSLHCLHSFF